MRLSAYAKINWTLDITGRLENGYHQIDTLMQPISLCDTLSILPDSTVSLYITGPVPFSADKDNLCLKAAQALTPYLAAPMGARMHLTKCIPIGSGLGGGSADCAAALVGLNRIWQTGLSIRELSVIAANLGADIPFFYTEVWRARRVSASN